MGTEVPIAAATILFGAALGLERLQSPLLKKGQIGRVASCLCMVAAGATIAATPLMRAFEALVSVTTDLLAWGVGIGVALVSAAMESSENGTLSMGSSFNVQVAKGIVIVTEVLIILFVIARAIPAKISGGQLSSRDVWVAFAIPFIVSSAWMLTGVRDIADDPIEWVRATFTEKVDSQIPGGTSPSPGKNVTPTGGGR